MKSFVLSDPSVMTCESCEKERSSLYVLFTEDGDVDEVFAVCADCAEVAR